VSYQTPFNNDAQGAGKRFYSHPRVCQFCTDKSVTIDYKQGELLRRFVSEDGKIRPRRQTAHVPAPAELAVAIKRARHLALLPFSSEISR